MRWRSVGCGSLPSSSCQSVISFFAAASSFSRPSTFCAAGVAPAARREAAMRRTTAGRSLNCSATSASVSMFALVGLRFLICSARVSRPSSCHSSSEFGGVSARPCSASFVASRFLPCCNSLSSTTSSQASLADASFAWLRASLALRIVSGEEPRSIASRANSSLSSASSGLFSAMRCGSVCLSERCPPSEARLCSSKTASCTLCASALVASISSSTFTASSNCRSRASACAIPNCISAVVFCGLAQAFFHADSACVGRCKCSSTQAIAIHSGAPRFFACAVASSASFRRSKPASSSHGTSAFDTTFGAPAPDAMLERVADKSCDRSVAQASQTNPKAMERIFSIISEFNSKKL